MTPASDAYSRARQTQCCDPIIDGVLGGLIKHAEALEAENARLREALRRAATHSIRGTMWDSYEALRLGEWIRAGMIGELPAIESPFVLAALNQSDGGSL